MISTQLHKATTELVDFSIDKNQTAKRILLFLKIHVPKFEMLFKQSENVFKLEDGISKELFRFLNDKARTESLLFQFNEKKGVDFTVFIYPFQMGASSIFMIEAKRLSKDHRDYVKGRTGGIERIKREQEEFGNHLNTGAMIGYIQDENHKYWENRINNWIDDLINGETDIQWNVNDKLIVNSEFSDYSSIHYRITCKPIILFHYWINMNQIQSI